MKDQTVRTSALEFVESGIGWLLDEPKEKLGLFWGEPGYGKTTAIKAICAEFNGIYLEAIQGWSPFHFVNSLLKRATGEKSRSFAGALEKSIEYLQDSRRLVFIDESERILSRLELIEAIRVLHDQGNVPIVLVGMTGIYNQVQAHPLFFDRFRYLGEVPHASLEDVQAIAELSLINFELDMLTAIYRDSRIARNCRRVTWAISRVEKFATQKKLETVSLSHWGDRPFLPDFPVGNGGKILPLVGRG